MSECPSKKYFQKSVEKSDIFYIYIIFSKKTNTFLPNLRIGSKRKLFPCVYSSLVFTLFLQFDNLPFTSNDENFVEAFAIFCGMGINNVKMYETAVLAMAKQQVNSF